MKKTIGKTAAYTLVLALACIGLVFSVLSIFCPKTMSDLYFKTGSNCLSAKYAAVLADRNGDTVSLALAVERCSIAGKDGDVVCYGKRLLEHDAFGSYAASRDTAESGSYADYIATLVATALHHTEGAEQAIAFAAQADGSGYAVRGGLVLVAVSESDRVLVQQLYLHLSAFPSEDGDYKSMMNVLQSYLIG